MASVLIRALQSHSTLCQSFSICSEEEKNLKIIFYESKYYESFGSIFVKEDICALIPEEEADVAILEEPEHLNWLRVPEPYKGEEKSQDGGNNTRQPVSAKDKAELGWKFKFRHVVGIVHTNYKAYTEQYGQGAKYITTPMLNALNSLVVRAYCHRVILLSGTLPPLCPYKEVIRNVHGVRKEFFQEPVPESRTDNDVSTNSQGEKYSPIYFIGKTIWAKGFDKVLEVEDLYRKKHNEYFTIDVYGFGSDLKAIQRAFFGRIPQFQQRERKTEILDDPGTAEVFKWNDSMRKHLTSTANETVDGEENDAYTEETQQSAFDNDGEQMQQGSVFGFVGGLAKKLVPLSVLGDLSKQTFDTTKATANAGVNVVKDAANASRHVAFTPGTPSKQKEGENQKMVFALPRSADEFRRNPIPARFLGAEDHASIRNIPEHKIFLNCSTTEVLCTTTAEALAMGKFVVLPKHRK